MKSERQTWAQIMARRQEQERRRQEEAQAWSNMVTEQLTNEHSKFMEEFDENERRIFGLIE